MRGHNKEQKVSVLQISKPSHIALSSIVLSLAYQGRICYPHTLEHSARVKAADLADIVRLLHEQLKTVAEEHSSHKSTVVEKYSKRRYKQIGTFRPPCFRELLMYNAFRNTELFDIYTSELYSEYRNRRSDL